MKNSYQHLATASFAGLLFFLCSSMTQCNRCIKGRLKIDKQAKFWIPYANNDSLSFKSENGVIYKFDISFTDTTKIASNAECATTYLYDEAGFNMVLNKQDSTIISVNLGSPSYFHLIAMSRDSLFISKGGYFEGANLEGLELKNFAINNVRYERVRLLAAVIPAKIDSIFIAKNYGIVSFKFGSNKFFLLQ